MKTSYGTIYLSGGMEKSKDQGAEWRVSCAQALRVLNYTPIDITAIDKAFNDKYGKVYVYTDNSPSTLVQYKSNIRKQFVTPDIRLIRDNSDALVAYYDDSFRLGAGSFAECQCAYDHEKPLFLVSAYPNLNDIPGWLKALTTKIFFSFTDLYVYLRSLPPNILKFDRYGNHSVGNQYLCGLCGEVFVKAKHYFVSKISPLYCKSCVNIVTKSYEAQPDRYDFAVNYLRETGDE